MSCRCCCVGGYYWQLHLTEDNINKVITRNVTMSCRCFCIGGYYWQLHLTEDNINKVITGMSPCPAGVVVSADIIDSFIWPKIISTKWLPAGMSPCPAGVVVSADYWQLHLTEDNINKVITGQNVTMSCRCCCIGGYYWQLHLTEDNINKVITGMSPCPAGVVVSADIIDSFIWPKIISTKWLPECHHVLQVLLCRRILLTASSDRR